MATIQKVSVALTVEQVAALRDAVDAGEYATTSEAVREALREWQWKRELRREDMQSLREQWTAGKASGAVRPVNMANAREEARHRLKKA